MRRKKVNYRDNYKFIDSAYDNDATFNDYFNRLTKIALSIFEWVNLPSSMDPRYLERTLFFYGQSALLKDNKYGFINTRCVGTGYVNIYQLPTKLNCYAYNYNEIRNLYTGIEKPDDEDCILVMNNWERIPTASTIELFARRLTEADRTCDVNIKAQKTPILLLANNKQRLTLENLYNQYNGNQPVIFGDKDQLSVETIKSINTEAPFVTDKVMAYKKEIWNEALEFLGINGLMTEKKERLITEEANANNEVINLNLQSYLVPRQRACEQFNKKFGLTGTDKEISVRVRSDLYNTIKKALSSSNDFITEEIDSMIAEEVVNNG